MLKVTKLEDIEIYLESLQYTKSIFTLCNNPILKSQFSICDQLKRAAISICANIAEGYGRNTKKDFAQFLSIALGSCNEVIAILDIIKLNYQLRQTDQIKEKYSILSKRIYSFRRYLSY